MLFYDMMRHPGWAIRLVAETCYSQAEGRSIRRRLVGGGLCPVGSTSGSDLAGLNGIRYLCTYN